MKNFELNGRQVKPVEIDMNLYCEFEEAGLSLNSLGDKPISMVRFYVAKCLGTTVEKAGGEVERHVMNGGSFEPILESLRDAMSESGFFRAFAGIAEEEGTGKEKGGK